MAVVLKNRKDDHVHVSSLNDGDLVEISHTWGSYGGIIAQMIVHGSCRMLIPVGRPSADGWPVTQGLTENRHPNCCVRILEPGEVLVVE